MLASTQIECRHVWRNFVVCPIAALTRSPQSSKAHQLIQNTWDTEFWNREDDASISAEDISDSDDEEVASDIDISKFPSEGDLKAKFDALERVENAYFQAKGQTKQKAVNLVDKKSISQTLRDASRKRLLDALGQAKLRLGNLRFAEESSAAHLETECFKKYQKAGKTFYNSQIAATVRWLSSSNSDQIQDSLQALTDQITNHAATSSSPCIAPDGLGKKPGEASDSSEFAKNEPSKSAKTAASAENMGHSGMSSFQEFISEEGKDCAIGTVDLPKIPSFGEFMCQKRRDLATSSSRAESQAPGTPRKASPVISKEGTTGASKKMKS